MQFKNERLILVFNVHYFHDVKVRVFMVRIAANEARKEFAEVLNRVACKGERIILQRRGKDVAALVPLEDLQLIEALEDEVDLEEARKALAEPGPNISLEEAKRRLGF